MKAAKGIFDEEEQPTSTVGDIKYSPTGALEFSSIESSTPSFKFSASADVSSASTTTRKTTTSSASTSQKAAASSVPLYDINAVRTQPKFKLSFISLQDAYDAKNVANLMMAKDTIVVVNIANLEDGQRRRAMDFLDGAK